MEKSNKRSAVDFYKEMKSENVIVNTVRVSESWEGPGSSSYTVPKAPPMPGMASKFGSFIGGHIPSAPSAGMVKGFLKNKAIGTAHNLAGMAVHMLIMTAVDYIVNKIIASMHPAEDKHIDGALNDFANTLPLAEKKALMKEKSKIRSEVKVKIGKNKKESAASFYQEAKTKNLKDTMAQNQKDAEKLIASRPKQKTQSEILAERIATTKAITQKAAEEKAARAALAEETKAAAKTASDAAEAIQAERLRKRKEATIARDARSASASEAAARAKAAEDAARAAEKKTEDEHVKMDHPLVNKAPSTAREDMMSAYTKAKSNVSSGIQKMKSSATQAFKNPTDMQKGLAIGAAVAISVPMLIWAASKVKAWWDKRGGSTVKMNDQELYDHIEKNFEDYAPSSVQTKSSFDAKFKRFYINDVIKQIRSAEQVHGSNLIPILNKRGALRGTGHTGVYEIHEEDPRSGYQKAGDWAKEHIGGALKSTGNWLVGSGKKVAHEIGSSGRDDIIRFGKLAMADCMAYVIGKSVSTLTKGMVSEDHVKKWFNNGQKINTEREQTEKAKFGIGHSLNSISGTMSKASTTPQLDSLKGKYHPTAQSIQLRMEAEKNFKSYIEKLKETNEIGAEGLEIIWSKSNSDYKNNILSGIAEKINEAVNKNELITDTDHWLAAR